MPNNYPFKPRGIVKWHAFAAVIDGEEQMEVASTKEILEFDLLNDQLDSLDNILFNAYQNNLTIRISYLEDNQVKEYDSKIININENTKKIYLHHKELSIENIIDIQVI